MRGLSAPSVLDQESGESAFLIAANPVIDGVFPAMAQQAVMGHVSPGLALSDLENSTGPFAGIGLGMSFEGFLQGFFRLFVEG